MYYRARHVFRVSQVIYMSRVYNFPLNICINKLLAYSLAVHWTGLHVGDVHSFLGISSYPETRFMLGVQGSPNHVQ